MSGTSSLQLLDDLTLAVSIDWHPDVKEEGSIGVVRFPLYVHYSVASRERHSPIGIFEFRVHREAYLQWQTNKSFDQEVLERGRAWVSRLLEQKRLPFGGTHITSISAMIRFREEWR